MPHHVLDRAEAQVSHNLAQLLGNHQHEILDVFRLAAEDRHLASAVCLSVLAAGASGNLIDRVARGSVIDFIYVSLIHFPVFNVADICVSVSTIVLVFLVLFYYKGDV